MLDELILSAWHHVEQYANNPIEADHSRLKHRLQPIRGLQTDRTTQVVIAGHSFVQGLRRGHYERGSTPRPPPAWPPRSPSVLELSDGSGQASTRR
jgi:transposase-like protein